MSQVLHFDQRTRWRSQSVLLRKWLTDGARIRFKDPVCLLDVDGAEQTVVATNVHPEDHIGAFRAYVREGEEVLPSGWLLECTGSLDGRPPNQLPIAAVARTRRTLSADYPPIFLSYRRSDTEAYAGRLHEVLTRSYGSDSVFMDEFSIRPGQSFPWAIQQAAARCQLMIVLVGPTWLTVQGRGNRRRLDDPSDFVRREICAALDRSIPVVPVLAQRAQVPAREELPDDLEGLEQLQFLELTARHWTTDVGQLVAEIQRQIPALARLSAGQSSEIGPASLRP